MPDDPIPDNPIPDDNPVTGGGRGFMLYLAIALIVILVLLVVFMNVQGTRASAASAITENAWALQSFGDPDGNTMPVSDGTVITAKFLPDGTLSGSGGCNHYSGRYMVKDTLIVISQIATTEMACSPGGIMQQENRYYASLQDAYGLRLSDRVLKLYGTDGKLLLTFVPGKSGT
jgi:heat shock protein HslJ